MKWTKHKPRKSGHYWLRYVGKNPNLKRTATVVEVHAYQRRRFACGEWLSNWASGWEWSDEPIPEPEKT